MYKNGQTDRRKDWQKRRAVTHLEIPILSVGNAGPPDTTYLYYSHVEGVTLKGSFLPV